MQLIKAQSISACQARWRCLVGPLLALYQGPHEKLYTPGTWLSVFQLATDTGGVELTATGDRWIPLQVGNQAILPIFTNPVSTSSTGLGPQWDLWSTPFYTMLGWHCIGYPLGLVGI